MNISWPEEILLRPITDLKVSYDVLKTLYGSGIKIIAQVLLMSNDHVFMLLRDLKNNASLELLEQMSLLNERKGSYFDDSQKIENRDQYKEIPAERLGLPAAARDVLARHGVGSLYSLIESYNEKFIQFAGEERQTIEDLARLTKNLSLTDLEHNILEKQHSPEREAPRFLWPLEIDPGRCREIAVETLDLSVPVRNALRRNGIRDLCALVMRYYNDGLVSCARIGQQAREEIGRFIKGIGPELLEAPSPKEPPALPQKTPPEGASWPLGIDPDPCRGIAVDALGLSARGRNALKRNGIHDLHSLVMNYYGGDLSSCPQIGRGTLEEIGALLETVSPDRVKAFLSKERREAAPLPDLPQDILRRPVKDLRLSVKAIRALQKMSLGTVEQALSLDDQGEFAQKYALAYEEVREQAQRLRTLGERYFSGSAFDIDLIETLRRDYGFKQGWLSEWFGVSAQWVSKALQKRANRGRWRGAALGEGDKRVFLDMAASKRYFYEAGPKKYIVLNNRADDAAVLTVMRRTVKCWFLADLPEDLRVAIAGAEMHRLSEGENPRKPLGKIVSILKKNYFCPDDPAGFRRLAARRNMPPDEYSMWRYHLPQCTRSPGLVTDEKVIQFFEDNLMDGRVCVSASPENRWIRTYSSRHGFSLAELIEFYGYRGRGPCAGE